MSIEVPYGNTVINVPAIVGSNPFQMKANRINW